MKFDPKKPHGLVYGVTGAAYEQDGQLYTPTGEPFFEERQGDRPLESRTRQPNNQQGKRQ